MKWISPIHSSAHTTWTLFYNHIISLHIASSFCMNFLSYKFWHGVMMYYSIKWNGNYNFSKIFGSCNLVYKQMNKRTSERTNKPTTSRMKNADQPPQKNNTHIYTTVYQYQCAWHETVNNLTQNVVNFCWCCNFLACNLNIYVYREREEEEVENLAEKR